MNISSHSGHILKHLFNTLYASFQYPDRLLKHAVGFLFLFFSIYMTILLILSVLKDKNSNFCLIVSINCYNLLFIFPGFWFLCFQDRDNVAAKFWMYHSHSSPSLASSALTSCTPFQPIDNVSCRSSGQMCSSNCYSLCLSRANLQNMLCSLCFQCYNEIIQQKVILFRYL